MNGKKAKQIRRLAVMISNPNSKGLLHEGQVEIYKKDGLDVSKDKDDAWYIRVFLRQFAQDSRQKLYRRFKELYTRHQLPEYFLNKMKQMELKRAA